MGAAKSRHRWSGELAIVLLALLGPSSACNSTSPSSWRSGICGVTGFCEERTPPAAQVDILCDSSLGASCSRETLTRVLDTSIGLVIGRPNSRIVLWTLGRNVAETAPVAERAIPTFRRGSERGERAQRERFANDAREYFLATARRMFEVPPVRRSPIAEGIAKIGMSDAGGRLRRIVVISDAREVGVADFECGHMPTDAQFLALLRRRGVLAPGLLTHVLVDFVFVESRAVPVRGCAVRIDRELRLRALWLAGLRAAGAERVGLSSGPPDFSSNAEQRNETTGGGR